ncbi:MAG: hypothetical protein ACLFMS_02645 [Halorhodospira sp.]
MNSASLTPAQPLLPTYPAPEAEPSTAPSFSVTLQERIGKGRRAWIASGIHPSEIPALKRAHACLRERHPSLVLIFTLADPRYAFETTARLRFHRLRTLRHSDTATDDDQAEAYWVDTDHEATLVAAHMAAECAFIGSTLVAGGSPDPTAAARAALPMVAGDQGTLWGCASCPASMAAVQRLERSGALRRVHSTEQLPNALADLLVQGALSRALGLHVQRTVLQAMDKSSTAHYPNA